MINEMVMRKLFLTLSVLAVSMLALFLSSLVAVSAQSAQNLGVGQVVTVQCYRGGVPYDCTQSNTTTTTTESATTSTTSESASSTTTTQAAPAATTTTETQSPSATSSPITTSASQSSGFDLSSPTTIAGIAIIIVAFVAAAILLQKGYFSRGSSYRYQYRP